jgi:hypothetical protein
MRFAAALAPSDRPQSGSASLRLTYWPRSRTGGDAGRRMGEGSLETYLPWLDEQWSAGVRNGAELWRRFE